MRATFPMLACRGGIESPELLGLLILWMLTLLLAIPNLFLIFRDLTKPIVTVTHFAIYLACACAGLMLCSGKVFQLDGNFAFFMVFAIPAGVIGQFVYLFVRWRWKR